jgi:hypothetical protein
VPVTICLLLEKGLAADIIVESAGMSAHIVNIVVLVLIPMVVIHIQGHAFSLSKCITNKKTNRNLQHSCFIACVVHLDLDTPDHHQVLFVHSWRYVGVFCVFHTFHENMELCAREPVVSSGPQATKIVAQETDKHLNR